VLRKYASCRALLHPERAGENWMFISAVEKLTACFRRLTALLLRLFMPKAPGRVPAEMRRGGHSFASGGLFSPEAKNTGIFSGPPGLLQADEISADMFTRTKRNIFPARRPGITSPRKNLLFLFMLV